MCPNPHNPKETIEAEVVNPAGWFGKTWLLELQCGFDCDYFVVEADTLSDAIDELAESERFGHRIAIQEHEQGDYGFPVAELSLAPELEKKIEELVAQGKDRLSLFINLRGEIVEDELSEPHTSGQGVHYDDDNLMYYGKECCGRGKEMPWPATYFHPDFTGDRAINGVSALEFHDLTNWDDSELYDLTWDNEKSDTQQEG